MLNEDYNEIAVIGSLLISPETMDIISGILVADDFYDNRCGLAYKVALELRDAGEAVDPVLIAAGMKKAEGQDHTRWLMNCMSLVPTAANVEAYCRLCKESANARRLENVAQTITEGLLGGNAWQAAAAGAIDSINDLQDDAKGLIVMGDEMAETWQENYDKVCANPDYAYCRTGYPSLDRKLGAGMFRQGLYIVGARPGMGKTTLGINIAENIAARNKTVLFISLEMSRTQIMSKRVARQGGINYTLLMAGGLSENGKKAAAAAVERLKPRPFLLTDKSGLTTADIDRLARRTKGLDAVVIDYFGLIKSPDEDIPKPRYEQTTNISAALKAMAKRLGVPILVLCQLNRENMGRGDKTPTLSDLRDTGAIEQDADAVILLHRPEYYSDEAKKKDYIPPEREDIKLIVAKNRHGETGTVTMNWRGKTGEIDEIDVSDRELPFGKEGT